MLVVLVGATGNLGGKIARELRSQGTPVRAIVRDSSKAVRANGVEVVQVDFDDAEALTEACRGADVVVSALSGLRPVIVEAQTKLVDAAVRAGVHRFIPSDFAIDYTKVPSGKNRNLDLRRDFRAILETKKIRATTIHNGAFADMLLKQAPIVMPKLKRVLYWENPDQSMDFTTMDDTAAFTARAAADPNSPRDLHIAGDQKSAREIAQIASNISGKTYGLLKGGSTGRLERLIQIARALTPDRQQLYPIWQGLQYLDNMFAGEGKSAKLDNDRYPHEGWTTVKDVLASLNP